MFVGAMLARDCAAHNEVNAKTRAHIVNELKQIGLAPAFADGSFVQSFAYNAGQTRGPNTALAEKKLGPAATEEFVPLPFSGVGQVENASLVFAGYGIQARNARGKVVYDDYAGMDVKGKVVIALLGDPALGAERSFFLAPEERFHGDLARKARLASAKGAAAILFVRGPLGAPATPEPPLEFPAQIGSGISDTKLLALQVHSTWAEKLLGAGKLEEWQKRIARAQAPVSRFLSGKLTVNVDLTRTPGTLENIAAVLPGTDPKLAAETIVLGAHYDNAGIAGEANASGVAAALAFARRAKAWGKNRRTLVFAFFAGGEIGGLGARHFVANASQLRGAPAGRIVTMLDFDRVRELKDGKPVVLGAESGHELPIALANAARTLKLEFAQGNVSGESDHLAFLEQGIPAMVFAVDTGAVVRVAELAFATVGRIDRFELPPTLDARAAKQAISVR